MRSSVRISSSDSAVVAPAGPFGFGTRISVRISLGASAVVNVPWKKSSMGIVRSPDALLATSSASSASITDPQSPAGSA